LAAPSIRNVGSVSTGTAGTITPTVPTHSADDILIAILGSSANASVTPTHTPPSGWVAIDSGANSTGTTRARCSVYWKRTAGGEANPDFTVTPTGTTACHHAAVVVSVQACLTNGTPYEGASNNQAAGASALALTLTTVTNETLGWVAVHHADNVGTGGTNDGSFTEPERFLSDSPTGIDGLLYASDKTIATAGSGQGATVTITSGGTSVGIAGVAFALLPTAAVDRLFAGTSDGVSAVTGAAQADRQIAGATEGGSTATATLPVDVSYAGESGSAATSGAAVAVEHAVAGSSTGGSTVEASLTVDAAAVLLAGVIDGLSTTAGGITADRAFGGTASGQATSTVALSADRGLRGAADGSATAAASATAERALASASAGAASAVGYLGRDRAFVGASDGASTAAAALAGIHRGKSITVAVVRSSPTMSLAVVRSGSASVAVVRSGAISVETAA